ncbi:MAG: FHA domain-containing protein [Planctomycetota bacterium]|nr:FHA domain-containing protein [Planctomycetota bacterium]
MEPGNAHQLIIPEEKGERTFSLPEGEIHLGRARSNELQLREKSVSRVHCRIERDGDRVVVFDAGTSNAARLRRHGKERIKGANGRILRDQDVLFLGRLEITYRGCSGPGAATTSASRQSEIPTVRGAVPVEKPQAPAPNPAIPQEPWQQQPAAQMPPPQGQPGQPYPVPQDPNQPYPAQQDPNQPYPAPQDPNQPYPGQAYPPQQGYPPQQPPPQQQQPGVYPPQQGYPPQQPPQQQPQQQQPPVYNPTAPGAAQQPVTFNPAPAEPVKPKKKIKKRIKPKKITAKSSKATKAVVPKKPSGSPAVPLAIGAVTLVVLLVMVSGFFKSMRDDNDLKRVAIEAQQEKTSRRQASEREKALQNQLGETNSKIEQLQQMLAALEKSNQALPGRRPVASDQDTPPVDPSDELAATPGEEEQVLPSSGAGGQEIAETRAMIASLIKKRNQLQKDYGGITGGTDTSKIEASIARRTAVMGNSGNRILNVEDDEDTRKTAVARLPQKVELSKKDYSELVKRLKETVGNYGLPIASPADLDPDLTELLRATGDDGARGLVAVYLYSSELHAKMEKTTSFLKRRIDALTANAYKINKDKADYKAGGGSYGMRHNHYLEQLQRLLELSEKKVEIKRSQKKRLAAFQQALGAGFGQLTSVESTKHLTSVYSKSKDTDMKRKMVGSFTKGNALQAVPALIKSLSSRDQELKGLVKSALASITGVNLGDNKKIWEAWWKENSDGVAN